MNEEYETSKIYLLGPCFVLYLVDLLQREPLPRIHLRWVVVGYVKTLPPR